MTQTLSVIAFRAARARWILKWLPPLPMAKKLSRSIASIIPLQLFAYHVALLKGTDVDQPRNLAKSVTVE